MNETTVHAMKVHIFSITHLLAAAAAGFVGTTCLICVICLPTVLGARVRVDIFGRLRSAASEFGLMTKCLQDALQRKRREAIS
jgi:hypothetical protein